MGLPIKRCRAPIMVESSPRRIFWRSSTRNSDGPGWRAMGSLGGVRTGKVVGLASRSDSVTLGPTNNDQPRSNHLVSGLTGCLPSHIGTIRTATLRWHRQRVHQGACEDGTFSIWPWRAGTEAKTAKTAFSSNTSYYCIRFATSRRRGRHWVPDLHGERRIRQRRGRPAAGRAKRTRKSKG